MKAKKHTLWCSISFVLLTLFFFLFCLPPAGGAAEKPGNSQKEKSAAPKIKALKSESPLHIASDRMEVDQQRKLITFEGHVVVQQDDLTITGNRMVVHATASNKAGDKKADPGMMNQIDHIEIEGDVKISQRDKIAVAEKSIYYHGEQKIVLIGSPSVSQGLDRVEGRLITLYLADGKSVVEGGETTPVQAILHPKKD